MAVTVECQHGETIDIAVITLENPPVNAISPWVPQALIDALAAQQANPAISAIVLRGAGRCFSAGADIAAFEGVRAQGPSLRDLLACLDALTKPLIMAVHGLAYGGGLEIVLSGHWRLCTVDAKFALPEINLGLIPGAGGTQRLPRLIGIAQALPFIMEGKPIDAAASLKAGLVDAIVEGDLTQAAIAFARTATIRRVRDLIAAPDPAAIEAARAAIARRPLRRAALSAALDCVAEAAAEDFDAGCAREHERFDALLRTDTSRALRHAFAAERAVARVPGLPKPASPGIASAAIIGAGTMGTGIALALLSADLPVTLIEPNADTLARAATQIRTTLETAVVRGRLPAATAKARLAALTTASDIAACAQADIVIEAVFEELGVKHAVFRALGTYAKPTAILASNTSTLNIDAIASVVADPSRVIGTHFFSPANVMRLLEIVRGGASSPQALADAMALAKRLGKVGVIAGNCDGFIGNRMFEEYLRQAYFLLEEGALPDQLDTALESWGMALGPLRVMDLAGGDIGLNIRKRRMLAHPDRPYSKIPDLIAEQGRYGQKTKAGWYLYPDGRKAVIDPAIDDLIIAHSDTLDLPRRPIANAEIVARCLLALINEGAKLLCEGIAARPLDIDQIYLRGYGFPAERGGPMFHADLLGLDKTLAAINHFAEGRHGWAWTPAPLLVELAARKSNFASLNAAR